MTPGAGTLEGRRILIVEDDDLIALVLVHLLVAGGAQVIGPIGRIDEAIALIEGDRPQIDVAVLDVSLHGKVPYPVADALAARSVRFLFATGHDSGVIEDKYRAYPRCKKPFSWPELVAALATC
jgi:CheY-like chemotaxis protein